MSYSDPQSWNDVDFAGNACDWTTRKNKLLYPAYEKLRRALVERCEASNTTVPAILDNTNPVGNNELVSYAWKTAYQSTITTLIPKYVNHTDSGGNWDGQTSIPNWTETTILAAIDPAETRIPATYIYSATWEIQQYKILNLLKWGSGYNISYTDYSLYDPQYKHSQGTLSDSWSSLASSFLTAPWQTYVGDYYWASCLAIQSMSSNYRELLRIRSKIRVNTGSTIGKSIDWYHKIREPDSGGHAAPSTSYFDANGDLIQTEKIHLVDSTSENTVAIQTQSNFFSTLLTSPNYNQIIGATTLEYQGWRVFGKDNGITLQPLEPPMLILKFTGPNGFKFKDW